MHGQKNIKLFVMFQIKSFIINIYAHTNIKLIHLHIQGVSGGIVNILGGGIMDYSQ